ncbi:MAG: FAD-dependent oxidoreductase [Anaerolineae bacterium]|nr:FAD-dependent oxidoreductase [Anaerolineae bacterium]
MDHSGFDVLIVGAGIFGTSAALELRQRGFKIGVIDPGPLPHPLAESTDINKVIRLEYGSDEQYMAMAEASLTGWRQWNAAWDEPLFHEDGVTMVTHQPMTPGGFEYESYQLALKRGHQLERLNADELSRRFPAWKAGTYVDGFYDREGGYAESGRTVEKLIALGKQQNINYHEHQTAAKFIEESRRVVGVETREGDRFYADVVLLCTGTWATILLPELSAVMKSTGQPVFHLRPAQPELFQPPQFSTFTADVSATGWYGFPLHPHAGVFKIANHGIGQRLHPEKDERIVKPEDEQKLRAMLADTFPSLVDAPIVYTRVCVYGDTLDEHFWIDHHPERSGLVVATGGSGHAFKFAPVLGSLIADAVEGKANEWLAKFRWRTLGVSAAGEEASRHHG